MYIAIDRTKLGCINLLMISLILEKSLPGGNFTQEGNSDFEEQMHQQVLPLLQRV